VVAKRQGNAPGRNRVKRIVREVMRAGEGSFPNGCYLVTWHGPCARMNRSELTGSIRAIIETIGTGTQSGPMRNQEQ